jgi:hypothetical protein
VKEQIKKAFEKHKQGRNCYIWKIRRELGASRDKFNQAIRELIVSQTVQVIGGDPSSMTSDQVEDSYQDWQGNLFPSIRWLRTEPEPKAKKSAPADNLVETSKSVAEKTQTNPAATEYLVANIETIKEVCQKNEGHQKRWNLVRKHLPNIESIMNFATFKQQIPIILAVIQSFDNKPKLKPPKKFMGWNVHEDKRGYVRLVRRIDGKKLKSLYVGKGWNEAKALEKIRSLEQDPKV